jgi:hypothetical protein
VDVKVVNDNVPKMFMRLIAIDDMTLPTGFWAYLEPTGFDANNVPIQKTTFYIKRTDKKGITTICMFNRQEPAVTNPKLPAGSVRYTNYIGVLGTQGFKGGVTFPNDIVDNKIPMGKGMLRRFAEPFRTDSVVTGALSQLENTLYNDYIAPITGVRRNWWKPKG